MKLLRTIFLLAAMFAGCAGTRPEPGNAGAGGSAPAPVAAQAQAQKKDASKGGGSETGGSAASLIHAIELSAEKIAGELPKGSRVAIVAFESESDNLSVFIMEELSGALFDRGLEIADRQNLDFVYNELKFQMSGDVDDEQIKAVGKFLAADMVVTGQFADVGGSYRYRVSAIHVERGARASVTRLDVDGGEETRRSVEAIVNKTLSVKTAGYGEGRSGGRMSAGAFIDRGIRYARGGQYESAINDFGMAQMLNPSLAAAFALRGRVMLASVHGKNSVADDFSFVSASRWMSIPKETWEVFRKAIHEYTEAIRLDPQNPKYYWERGGIYLRGLAYDKALADYDMAIKLDPDFTEAYNERGIVHLHDAPDSTYAKAFADFERALKLKPDHEDAYYNLTKAYSWRADVYERNKEYDKAVADYETVLKRDPKYNFGGMYSSSRHIEILKEKKAGTWVDPSIAEAFKRGVSEYEKHEYKWAIDRFEEVLKKDPNHKEAKEYLKKAQEAKVKADAEYERRKEMSMLISKGIDEYDNGNYAKAIEIFEEILRRDPSIGSVENRLKWAREKVKAAEAKK